MATAILQQPRRRGERDLPAGNDSRYNGPAAMILRTWTGILCVVISAAGFSTLGILGRYAYAGS